MKSILPSADTTKTTTLECSAAPAKPLLKTILSAICADARSESLKFVIRSDTGHDGE